MNTVLIRPLITEKTMADVSRGKYSFVVTKQTSKNEIKSAIKQRFNVTVKAVATSIVKGKSKRVGAKRQEISDAVWKRASVTLKKGDKIALFEPGGEKS